MNFAGKELDPATPHVMGILNITPDSFSDGGELFSENGKLLLDKIMQRAEAMQQAGAAILDVGGESTRPGAKPVSPQEEMDRVLPVVELLSSNLDVIISVDTSSAELMRASAGLGAGLINDVRALQKPGALEAVAETQAAVCLMHMQGQPSTMQNEPEYHDVVVEVKEFLNQRIAGCEQAGINRERIIIDPGFGFGKTLAHNLELLGRLSEFKQLKLPVLVGLSRKRMLGTITGRPEKDRVAAGVAAASIALMQEVSIIRTHDVAETADAVKLYRALENK
ncbi:MAG: dihydropteroate synthase [Gammaproteobacteria bacterium]|nr:dihydropteroate synthase [Gammaproteobacteria bacterium]|tara:strand:- start:153182 stop:154021 length:840 start_codon:yes stop_codon:yes gene_type:complete